MKTRPDLQFAKLNDSYRLKSSESEIEVFEAIQSASTTCSSRKKKWRRKRKNNSQVKVLMDEFKNSPSWTKEQVVELAKKTGLSEAQVYKWGWDYKKKLRKQATQYNYREFECREVMPLSKMDLDMASIQRAYKEFIGSMNSIVPLHLVF